MGLQEWIEAWAHTSYDAEGGKDRGLIISQLEIVFLRLFKSALTI